MMNDNRYIELHEQDCREWFPTVTIPIQLMQDALKVPFKNHSLGLQVFNIFNKICGIRMFFAYSFILKSENWKGCNL